MRFSRRALYVSLVAAISGSGALFFATQAPAQVDDVGFRPMAPLLAPGTPFPPQGDDTFYSLGQFQITVRNPAVGVNGAVKNFQTLAEGCPGYSAAADTLTSPLLFDYGTRVQRSGPHVEGSFEDNNGANVGLIAPTSVVADYEITHPIDYPEGAPPAREVHTKISHFFLSDVPGYPLYGTGLVKVKAGADAPLSAASVGEVQSLNAGGVPANDFPASTFFNIYVQASFPKCGGFTGPNGPFMVISNRSNDPLYVKGGTITDFPPRVVYTHGNLSAVAMYFENAGDNWAVGDIFGYLVLSGHGANFDPGDPTQVAEFATVVATQTPMPLPPVPTATPCTGSCPTLTPTATPTAGPPVGLIVVDDAPDRYVDDRGAVSDENAAATGWRTLYSFGIGAVLSLLALMLIVRSRLRRPGAE